jgi:hypothetical protein
VNPETLEMDYINAIVNAMDEARFLKSGLADWSSIGDLCNVSEQNKNIYRDAWLSSYDDYRQTIWGATYMNLLGKHLMKCKDKTNVLELGSGTCRTIQNMTKGNPEAVFEYTSIDRATDSNCFGSRHIKANVFDVSNVSNVLNISDDYRFDILILDVEPHGKEIEIYEKFAMYGAAKHVVILKCVGWMDVFTTSLADRFLYHLKSTNRLVDYFGIGDCDFFTRDVTVVISRDPEPDVFVGEIARFVEECGGTLKHSPCNEIPPMVCCGSKELIDMIGRGYI